MIRPAALLFALFSLLLASAANADDRSYSVSSFERIRIEGPFDVRLQTGKAPSGRVVSDTRTLDLLDLHIDGTTLVVRLNGKGWAEAPAARSVAPVLTLTTLQLRSAVVNAGGRLTLAGARAPRVDLAVNGSGAIVASALDADDVRATIIGTGTISVTGRAGQAQLLTNGSGRIAAEGLAAGDLVVRVDGTGETNARARYTARVTTNGLGRVTVAGNPKCDVRALAGGPIICGKN
ncbi:MAG: GIN domain-containing protein [Sphingomonas sp.]